MPYEPTRGVYRYIDEELDVPHQTSGHRPKQQLPRRDIAAAERQAVIEAKARLRNFQGTLGMTPDALPRVRPRPDADDDEELYTQRPPRSAVRYQPEEIYQSGNTHVYAGQVVIPKKRRSAQPQQLLPAQQEIYREDIEEQETERPKGSHRRKTRVNPLAWLGLGMIAMLFLWAAGNYAINWWQIHQDDSTYGRPRTFQIDAVVGHGDSTSNPSHFIAVNLNRHVIVIEIPGGDPTKARIYPITTLFGDGQDLTPVTITFQASSGNGKPDMIIHIQDQRIPFYNDGTQFRPTK